MAVAHNKNVPYRRWLTTLLYSIIRLGPPANRMSNEQAASERLDQQQAFESFFVRFERHIFGYLWRMTGDEEVAYDLSQETFLRAWQHFSRLRDPQASGGWLYRVATNQALTYLKRHTIHRTIPLDEDALSENDHATSVAERDAIQQTLLLLPSKQRAVLVLAVVNDFSHAEVSKILGLSQPATRRALWRARENFRKHYIQEGHMK